MPESDCIGGGDVMKTIVVKWVEGNEYCYGEVMRVIESDHKRFSKGTMFSFGFFNVAIAEGYTIILLP